jgi:Spx/MgsR family transcriptional regulator
MTLYGIPNCDTTKKAMDWLKKRNIPFVFHNYKEAGISEARLREWDKKAGWENILNKRSTTWRSLSAAQQEIVKDKNSAIAVMLEHNSIIKRPVLEYKGKLVVGFDDKAYEKVVSGK